MPISGTKIAFITGAAIRIGRGIAECLLENNYSLILHANKNFDELNRWSSLHKNKIIKLIKADLSIQKEQEYLCQEVNQLGTPIDLLVNNASYFAPKEFQKIARFDYTYMQMVNLEAPFFITQQLVGLIEKSKYKNIINIADALWEKPKRNFSHYAISKAGLCILTKSLALELAPNIRVNAVAPGAILLPSYANDISEEEVTKQIPFRRLGKVQDIGQMIVNLTELSPYVTGQIISVDGGRSLI